MRTVAGEVVLPADAPGATSGTVLIELRDVSVADAPSTVVASTKKQKVKLAPGRRIPFTFKAPEAPGRRLALRVQIDGGASHTRSRASAPSTYLTTQSITVQPDGDVKGIVVPVQKT